MREVEAHDRFVAAVASAGSNPSALAAAADAYRDQLTALNADFLSSSEACR